VYIYSSQHPTYSSLHPTVDPIRRTPTPKRSSLSAAQYLYSNWLTDLAQHQHMTMEEDPILDALNLSFLESLVTNPHLWPSYPKFNNHHYQGTTPLFFQP